MSISSAQSAQNIYPDYVSAQRLDAFIGMALEEDIGNGDYSSLSSVDSNARGQARLLLKQPGILAGVALARHIFHHLDSDLVFEPILTDGAKIEVGQEAFRISGNAQSILSAERVVLNCMQRMSGIASHTHRYAELIAHTKTRLLDTRKTTPGFRMAEKWAVCIGGGFNHRFGLYDMIMLKDNHIDYAGGITAALNACTSYMAVHNLNLFVVVEARTIQEAAQAASHPFAHKRILLDNMSIAELHQAIAMIAGRCQTEASGGITSDTIGQVAETGVDFISVGALTHSAPCLDMSLKAC